MITSMTIMTIYWLHEHLIAVGLSLACAFLLALFFVKWKSDARAFCQIKPSTWIFLFLIIFVGAILRIVVVPSFHQMYTDEPLYIEQAKNIIDKGAPVSCQYTLSAESCHLLLNKPPLWPLLLALAFSLFGSTLSVAFATTKALAFISIFLSFVVAYLISKKESIGLWASFFTAISPVHIVWSNTVETSIASLALILATMAFFLLYLKAKDIPLALVALILALFSILLRYENLLLMPLFLLVLLLEGTSISPRIRSIVSRFFPTILTIMSAFAILIFAAMVGFFRPSFSNYLPYAYVFNFLPYLKGISLYFSLAIPVAIGMATLKKNKTTLCLLLLPLLLLSVMYVPLSFESRVMVLPSFFISVLAAFGADHVLRRTRAPKIMGGCFIVALGALCAVALSPSHLDTLYKPYASLNLLETTSANSLTRYVPKSCTIVANFPTIINAATDNNAMAIPDILRNPLHLQQLLEKGECFYFFYDQYCHRNVQGTLSQCGAMMRRFDLEHIQAFPENGASGASYALYRIAAIKDVALAQANQTQKNRVQ
jgi:hypothetical protein